jgi:hypothetical protein
MSRLQAGFSLGRNSVIGRSVRTRLAGALARQGHCVHVGSSPVCYQRRQHNLGMPQNLNLRVPANAAWFAVCAAIASGPIL